MFPDQFTRRLSPQIGQVATPFDESSRSIVAQPLVEQKRGWAAAARRRSRRMAWARIGAPAVEDRVSIEEITLVSARSNRPGTGGSERTWLIAWRVAGAKVLML
jgi:hypothetical protein